jgi:hypothetical protein
LHAFHKRNVSRETNKKEKKGFLASFSDRD